MSDFALWIGSILEMDFKERAAKRWKECLNSFALPGEKITSFIHFSVDSDTTLTLCWKWSIPGYLVVEYQFDISHDGKVVVYTSHPSTGLTLDNVRAISPEQMANLLASLHCVFEIMES